MTSRKINGEHGLKPIQASSEAADQPIDPHVLGVEGNQLVGRIDAFTQFRNDLAGYAAQSRDPHERRVITDVVKALDDRLVPIKERLTTIILAALPRDDEDGQ